MSFLKEVKLEASKLTFPTASNALRMLVVIAIMILIFSGVITLLDALMYKIVMIYVGGA